VVTLQTATITTVQHPLVKQRIAQQVTRTVVVTMADTMRFSPATVQVRKGETLEFIVRNTGKVKHEMVLGTAHDFQKRMPP
jgi:uncharacterized cupredoxin-like copper-binding protein